MLASALLVKSFDIMPNELRPRAYTFTYIYIDRSMNALLLLSSAMPTSNAIGLAVVRGFCEFSRSFREFSRFFVNFHVLFFSPLSSPHHPRRTARLEALIVPGPWRVV